ncbi:inosine-uridine preferring nucleoside hydrolase-like [Anopheles maculipalpis]|uniref:inosine-uridine preferring nucleoside hydrolase-like n=1 Tax=Anopheles maculipalpis TaxID=1496333 RepID=UPI0021596AF5|nr:inosine-uridine preferring nucleoside hydrolase-like [Anopheles maculipalpis]
MTKPRKVIIDLDVGTDDAWALWMLLKCEESSGYEVIGITCVNGNTTVDNVVENTLTLLTAMGRTEVPVFRGAEEQLIVPAEKPDVSKFHGVNGLGDIDFGIKADRKPLQQEHAVSALTRLITQHKGAVDLIFIGPLTNLALAMKLHPGLLSMVGQLYIMGGNRHGVGNVTWSAEFNFHTDPEAAQIVLHKEYCPVTIVPWETCQRHAIPMQWRMEVLGANEAQPVLRILNVVEKKTYAQRTHWMPCDAYLVAAYVQPECVEKSHLYSVAVELHGALTRGQMILNHRLQGNGHVRIVDDINEVMFKGLCFKTVA